MDMKKLLIALLCAALLSSAAMAEELAVVNMPVTEEAPAEALVAPDPAQEDAVAAEEYAAELGSEAGDMAAANASDVALDEAHFPDLRFRAYVRKNFDKDGDGSLSPDEIAAITRINLSSEPINTITSVRGIEYFPELTYLDCSMFHLKDGLDVSGNEKLEFLACYWCWLTELDVRQNPRLVNLNCAQNGLTALDLNNNGALRVLCCFDNLFKTLDLRGCPALVDCVARGKYKLLETEGARYTLGSGDSLAELQLSEDVLPTVGETLTLKKSKKTTVAAGTLLQLVTAKGIKSCASSKKAVATVNKRGIIAAKKPGKATITVTLKNKKKLKLKLTVN